MYPNTANIKEITDFNQTITMDVSPESRIEGTKSLKYNREFALKYQQRNIIQTKSTNDLGPNLVQNGEFNIDNLEKDDRDWTELRTPGKWYYTDGNSGGISDINGNFVFKNNTGSYEVIEQSFPVLGGAEFEFSMEFGAANKTVGGDGIDLWLDNFNANGEWIGETYITTDGNTITSSGTILPSATHFQFYIGMNVDAWVDNIIYRSADVVTDTDGDGINDNGDDYPNDPTKAYKVLSPTYGYQTVAFEDLWPYTGDYDFNDMVVSYKAECGVSPTGEYIDAQIIVWLDAAGGSTPLGLALNILDVNNDIIPYNVISSVSGDAMQDPNVNNSVIIFNNRFNAQSTYYTNTSLTENKSIPDSFTFTINFTNTKNGNTVTPTIYKGDVFIFKTSDRTAEIHLPGKPPTPYANTSLFGTGQDASDLTSGNTYRTENGLPWAIEVVTSNKTFKHPLEKEKVSIAYTSFNTWATSLGTKSSTWYLSPNSSKVFSFGE